MATSGREIVSAFKRAEWRSAQDVQGFVMAAAQASSDDLARMAALLGGREPASVRERRARVLGELIQRRPERALFPHLLKLLKGSEPAMRRALVPMLAATSDSRQHDELCALLKSSDDGLRDTAAAVLKEAGGKTALQTLHRMVLQGRWAGRALTLEVVAEIAGHHAVETLAVVLGNGTPAERLQAVRLLGDLRYMKNGRQAAADALEPVLFDGSPQIVAAAVQSYGAVATEEAFFEVAERCIDSPEVRLAAAAVLALGNFDSPAVVDLLGQVLRSAAMNVRMASLDALERIGTEDVLRPLASALADPQLNIRTRASEVLVSLAQTERVALDRMLLWLLRDRDVNVRRTAIEVVRHCGGDMEALYPRLLNLLRDEDWWVRERVVDVLVEMAGERLTRHMVAFLQDESDVVRRYAVEVLMRIRDPRALGALVRTAQSDTDWWVQERAVEAIGTLEDARALPYVIDLAQSQPELGFVCAGTLARFGGAEAIATLLGMLDHPDPDTRLAVIDALERCGDRELVAAIGRRSNDPDARVRERLARLLATWNIHADGLAAEQAGERLAGLDRMLRSMVQAGGDDLFLVADRKPYMKRHGEMVPVSETVLRPDQIEALVKSIISPAQRRDLEALEDVDMSYEVESPAEAAGQGRGLRFRLNIFQQATGYGLVFRAVPAEVLTAEALGWPTVVAQLSELRSGLVLVTGPTGCGKSTTLAAMVDMINRRDSRHILTIEDPIEAVHPHQRCLVNQREVGTHTETFATALRSALREDPDVILVGEMRDLETIAFAVTAAETGHLVLATLHTVSADTSIDRIINVFPAEQQPQVRSMVAESLRAVLCQQLLEGKKPGTRVLAMEVLLNNDAVSNIIRKGKTYQLPSLVATSRELGMQSMDNDLLRLVHEGRVDPVEAWLKANNKKEFEPLLPAGTQLELMARAERERSELAGEQPDDEPALDERSGALAQPSGPIAVPNAAQPNAARPNAAQPNAAQPTGPNIQPTGPNVQPGPRGQDAPGSTAYVRGRGGS